jgi:hypothetical protein
LQLLQGTTYLMKTKYESFFWSQINNMYSSLVPGVKKRNKTERNGINGIFSETKRNETENNWEDEKRN